MDIKWDILLKNIEQQKCVLILGPELIDYGGKTFFGLLSETMQRDEEPYVQHFFLNEELVQFDLNIRPHESYMYSFLDRFYRQRTELNDVFERLVQLPFPVFISLFPDTRLADTFRSRQLDFSEAHYPREQNPEDVDVPSRDKPLVYNLLGTLDKFDTVLTFDHLFEYLKGILGARELPMNLRKVLKETKTFVFLGVKFDKWHMQVLLKMLMDGSFGLRYASSNIITDEVKTFIGNRLVLQFINEEPSDFLNALYDQCKRRGLLRSKPSAFVSYSYKDDTAAFRLRRRLETAGLRVIMGQIEMKSGEDITAFIQESVSGTDCTISMISENSLLSPWVAQETATIVREKEQHRKLFVPCYLEPSFMDSGITDRILDKLEQNIKDLSGQMQQRIAQNRPFDDLMSQLKQFNDHKRETADFIRMLRNANVINLTDLNFEEGATRIIKDIQGFVTENAHA